MKDIDTDVPLRGGDRRKAKGERADADRFSPAASSPPASLELGSFYAEGRNLIDARKTHLSRVGMGPQVQPPAVAGTQEIPSQRKMLAMDAHEATAELPPSMGDADASEPQHLYKPKRMPADAVNHEA